ncbi:gamma-glutamylcyclotransferase family protein [Haladaptatus salinisoli]|uniref:gamma-glutamylcyclotransferase family protein n=1 Tax=Haladaptatus salinisoli TaxID=2884876 RepID=UPI001D0B55E3|nr:gamma-glutamylcyclotransferase family protein [Haladaptatus salinisoli]
MRVFVYGTLTDPNRVASVVETFEFVGDAVLSGLHRVDGRYPTLAPGGETDGRLLETDDVAALDAYEGVEYGLYVRVAVPTAEGGEAEVYVGDANRLGVAESVSWPGGGTLERRVRRFVDDRDVRVRVTE